MPKLFKAPAHLILLLSKTIAWGLGEELGEMKKARSMTDNDQQIAQEHSNSD